MKNINILMLALTMMLAMFLAACGGGNEAANSTESNKGTGGDAEKAAGPVEAKIGVISYITGPGAGYGEAITNGVKLAVEELNAKGS